MSSTLTDSKVDVVAAAAPFGFGGEAFLKEPLPNYPRERLVLGIWLALAGLLWMVVLPYVLERVLLQRKRQDTAVASKSTSQTSARGRGTNGNKLSNKNNSEAPPTAELPVEIVIVSALLGLLSMLAIILSSSNNTLAARGVFEAPLLTHDECQRILDFAARTAKRNHEAALAWQPSQQEPKNQTIQDFLKPPYGYHKTRHNNYPTTDLNLRNDPFLEQEREYLQSKLDARLAPLLERIFGVIPSAIRANDMFVVQYNADDRPFLAAHTDDGDISINILLSHDFEGGGTRFWHRPSKTPFATVQPSRAGQVLAHSAQMHHEGLPVSNGTRVILVGFLAVDRKNPLTNEYNHLSWFASWLSLPYWRNKSKEGYLAAHDRLKEYREGRRQLTTWWDHKYVRLLFRDSMLILEWLGDVLAPHQVKRLVGDEHVEGYLRAMDRAYQRKMQRENNDMPRATWFQGQQLNLDIDGSLASVWKTRQDLQDL